MPVDTTSPCPGAAVKISSSTLSPPPRRCRFPCPAAGSSHWTPSRLRRFLSQVAVPEVPPVCNVRKLRTGNRHRDLNVDVAHRDVSDVRIITEIDQPLRDIPKDYLR